MKRGLFMFGAIVLLFSCPAMAMIFQGESSSLDALIVARRTGSIGSADSGVSLLFGQNQEAYDLSNGQAAVENQAKIFTGRVVAVGDGGTSGGVVGLTEYDVQSQYVNDDIIALYQGSTTSLDTVADKYDGAGGAIAVGGVVGAQNQIALNQDGLAANSQVVGAVSYSAVAGAPDSNAIATNSLDVTMGQTTLMASD